MERIKPKKIEISPPKGTRDFLPEEMIIRQEILEKVRSVFEAFGFQPLETPAIESWEVLSAKGAGGPEILKETYKFKDRGGRWVGLRYDLTVPLARVVASRRDLTLPFKRYQIEKVWRYGDVTKGRLREFLQADIDTVGCKSMLADAEIVACAISVLTHLGFKEFFVRLNHRKILTALVKYAGVDDEKVMDTFRGIDKLDKIGMDGVRADLLDRGIPEPVTNKVLKFIRIGEAGPEGVLEKAGKLIGNIKEGREGIEELKEMISYLRKMDVEPKFKVDLSLARGLDYYTGPIFEVFASKGIGSVAGGGRYDGMIGLFSGKEVPATGISLGIERVIEVMKERKMIETKRTKVKVFVANVDEDVMDGVLRIVQSLRECGIPSDFNLRGRSLRGQLEYANSLSIPYVLIIGSKELKTNKFRLKDMKTGKEETLSMREVLARLE